MILEDFFFNTGQAAQKAQSESFDENLWNFLTSANLPTRLFYFSANPQLYYEHKNIY